MKRYLLLFKNSSTAETILMQDGAPAHFSIIVRNRLEISKLVDRGIVYSSPVENDLRNRIIVGCETIRNTSGYLREYDNQLGE